MHPANTDRPRIPLPCCALAAVVLITACSSPTGPDPERSILQRMLAIPDVPMPQEAAGDNTLVGYVRTLHYAQTVLEGRLDSYDGFVESLLERRIRPEAAGDSLRWVRESDEEPYWELSVVPGDTLQFAFRWLTVQYGIEGWIAPQNRSGHIGSGWWYYDWEAGEAETHVSYGGAIGRQYEVVGGTDGSGSIDVYSADDLLATSWLLFHAEWDPFGHGSSTAGPW